MMDKDKFTSTHYEDIKIIRNIGNGMMGTVYLGQLGNKKIAVKVAKIIPAFIRPKGQIWRELEYYKFAKKHKSQLHLYMLDYKIISNCGEFKIHGAPYKHPAADDAINRMDEKYKKLHLALRDSKYCLVQIMSYIEGPNLKFYFDSALKKPHFTKQQYYSWYIDILEQVSFLHSKGYSHGDIHTGNITITKDKATLIDFGLVNSRKWDAKWSVAYDYISIYYLTHVMNHFEEFKRLNKLLGDKKFPIGHKYYLLDLKKFLKTKESKQFLELCKFVPGVHRKHIAFDLADMLIPGFMKELCGAEYANELKFKELWLIDFEDVLFMLNNIFTNGPKVVIEHLKNKSF